MWFIEGLPDDQVAMFLKTHHALVDGVSGAGLAEILCDIEPNPPEVDEPEIEPRGVERAPSDAELVARGLLSVATSPWRTASWFTQWSRQMVSNLRITRSRGGRTALDLAPRAPWNGVIGPLRGFAFNSVALADVKAIRAAFDVKVNDVVLALASSAVRGYLLQDDSLPDSPLVASVPMSMRSGEDVETGNKIINLYASLETHIDDPVDRLRSIAKGMEALKEIGNALKAKDIRRLSETVVPGLANLGWRTYQAAQLEARTPLPTNLIVSNVPGPPIPLYSAGALITRLHPVPPIVVAQGLNVTVMSYMDSIDFGFTVDRDLVPDVWAIADGVQTGLEELKQAAGI
jgi:WS/DGAT/MGAT family acyltransferase